MKKLNAMFLLMRIIRLDRLRKNIGVKLFKPDCGRSPAIQIRIAGDFA